MPGLFLDGEFHRAPLTRWHPEDGTVTLHFRLLSPSRPYQVDLMRSRFGIDTREPEQADWRFCRQCYSMFFDGYPTKGVCPTGGGHAAAGYDFVLPHDVPAHPLRQGDWRFCDKCQAMFFDGYPTKGVCPADSLGHRTPGSSYRSVLAHDLCEDDQRQGAWRFCDRCFTIFFDGYPAKGVSVPPAGITAPRGTTSSCPTR